MVIVTWVVVFKTPVGLRLRSVGEHPRAADTVGINVYLTRYVAVTFSGVLAAAGGVYLALGLQRVRSSRTRPPAKGSSHSPRSSSETGARSAQPSRVCSSASRARSLPACRSTRSRSRPCSRRCPMCSRSSPSRASSAARLRPPPLAVPTSSSSAATVTSRGSAWVSVVLGRRVRCDASARRLPDTVQRERTSCSTRVCDPGRRRPSRSRALAFARRARRLSALRLGADRSAVARAGRVLGIVGPGHGRERSRLARGLRAARVRRKPRLTVSRRVSLQSPLRVRHRLQPPRGPHSSRDRFSRARAAHEDPAEVPPRPRGRELRHPARPDLRPRFPAFLRRVARPRRPAVRRRVQLTLRRRRRGCADPCPPRLRRGTAIARSANRASRFWRLLGIAILTALVIAAWRFGGPEGQMRSGARPAGPDSRAHRRRGEGSRATVTVRATSGGSWMEVREVSASGRLLYSGTLEQGQTKRFEARTAAARPRRSRRTSSCA